MKGFKIVTIAPHVYTLKVCSVTCNMGSHSVTFHPTQVNHTVLPSTRHKWMCHT